MAQAEAEGGLVVCLALRGADRRIACSDFQISFLSMISCVTVCDCNVCAICTVFFFFLFCLAFYCSLLGFCETFLLLFIINSEFWLPWVTVYLGLLCFPPSPNIPEQNEWASTEGLLCSLPSFAFLSPRVFLVAVWVV